MGNGFKRFAPAKTTLPKNFRHFYTISASKINNSLPVEIRNKYAYLHEK